MDYSPDEMPSCPKCENKLPPEALPPPTAFAILQCPSCKGLLGSIFGSFLKLNEKMLSNSAPEARAEYLYKVLMTHFSDFCQGLAQAVAEDWDEIKDEVQAQKRKEKENELKELQENIQDMDLEAFNEYIGSLEPPEV